MECLIKHLQANPNYVTEAHIFRGFYLDFESILSRRKRVRYFFFIPICFIIPVNKQFQSMIYK